MSNTLSLIVSILSAVTAVVSLVFSWRAVKIAERTVSINLFNELQKTYQSDGGFLATKTVWEAYQRFPECKDKLPISKEQALQYVQKTDRDSVEWKAMNNASAFWRHASFLIRKGYIEKEVVFEAFTSPYILGFLYPIENAFLEHHGYEFTYETSLQMLYDVWMKSPQNRKAIVKES